MSADALQKLVARHVAQASVKCPSLKEKAVTPHTLCHAATMNLLVHGVDLSVIALWLGHESVRSRRIRFFGVNTTCEMAMKLLLLFRHKYREITTKPLSGCLKNTARSDDYVDFDRTRFC